MGAKVYRVFEMIGQDTVYLRVAENGVHWQEKDVKRATLFTWKQARKIADDCNKCAKQGGYIPRYGICSITEFGRVV